MNKKHRRDRRIILRAGAALPLGGILSACGGGGGDTDTNVSAGGGSAPIIASNDDLSTFAIGITYTENGATKTFITGTGFAISDKLLATNAHVTRAILDHARNLARANAGAIISVDAYQSATGKSFMLIEALEHPSYAITNLNAGGTRSYDVGLLVSRDPLPNRLTLASVEEASALRKADVIDVNGYPGDVTNLIFPNGFTPGVSIPQSSLFRGTIQALRNFDERVVITNQTIDMFEYSVDTTGGTSGSAVVARGKVVGVNNSGVIEIVVRPGPNNTLVSDRSFVGSASFGLHVKHLHNLIKEYETGVLSAERRFRVPPPSDLVNATPGGGAGTVAQPLGVTGTVASTTNSLVNHTIRLNIDANLNITGTSQWPAQPNRTPPLPARQFTLTGRGKPDGTIEIVDNTPDIIPNFRQGVYLGNVNFASGRITGQYFEYDQPTNELIYFADWAT
jgi:V8-like Glu-specific endopeptidase